MNGLKKKGAIYVQWNVFILKKKGDIAVCDNIIVWEGHYAK